MLKEKNKSVEDKFLQQLVKGIDKIREKTYDKSRMSHLAREFTGKFLNDLMDAIIEHLKSISEKRANIVDIQTAVQAVLPKSLGEYAASEGQKEVFLAQSFNYDIFSRLAQHRIITDKKMLVLIKRKEEDPLCRNIISGIPNILVATLPKARLEQHGNKNISFFIVKLADRLIDELKRKNSKRVTLADLQNVVAELFSPPLSEHANAEGQKMLLDFENEEYEFTPKTIVDTISEELSEEIAAAAALGEQLTTKDIKIMKHKKAMEGFEFQSGLMALIKQIHPDGRLPPISKSFISRTLNNLSNAIIKSMKEQKGKKTYEMAEGSIGKIFPPLLKEHAIAEGRKMLHRHGTGEYDVERATTSEEELKWLKRKKTENLEVAVESIAKSISPNIKLRKQVVSAICDDINSLCHFLINSVKDSNVTSVTPDDIQKVVREMLPQELAMNAVAEGRKMVVLYDNKGITFVPLVKRR